LYNVASLSTNVINKRTFMVTAASSLSLQTLLVGIGVRLFICLHLYF
jgi:hypothetical protein